MSDFLLTLFLGDTYKEYHLETVQLNELNSDLEQYYLVNKVDYGKLFVEKDNKWHIHKKELEKTTISSNGKEIQEKAVEHGDYFVIHDMANDVQFEMLITDTSKLSLSFGKYKLVNTSNIFIGRLQENTIGFSINNAVSRKHAAIRFEGNGKAFIEDISRKTGVFVNGKKVITSELHYGDTIFIMGLKIVFLGDFLALNGLETSCTLAPYKSFALAKPNPTQVQDEKFFTRSPRIIKSLEKSDYEIEAPPPMQKRQSMPLLLTIGPSFTMSIAMLVSLGFTIKNAGSGGSVWASGAMAVSMLLGALFWPLVLNRYQKKLSDREENHRIKSYKEYIYEQRKILEEKKQRNNKILTDIMFPDPKTIIGLLDSEESKRRLWEKIPSDEDFLEVRLGKGEREFDVKVTTPQKGFVLHVDPLADEPKKLVEEFKMLRDVPITLSLKTHKLIGVFGQKEKIINNVKCMALNLAGLHSYEEVKLVFVFNKKDEKEFEWVTELPHVWSSDRTLRHVATNKEEVHQLFMSLDEVLKEREQQAREDGSRRTFQIPKYIFFIADDSLVENEPLMRYLTNPENPVDVSSIFIGGQLSLLPKDCDVLIQNDEKRSGIYFKNKFNNRLVEFQPDQLENDELLEFEKKISKLKVKSDNISLNVPEKVTFLGMYRAGSIEALGIDRLWKQNESFKSLAVPIGIKAGGELFSLDIHENYHGPHGLVAGMTGSGKSEFLQAYIASAAINYHPDDLSFVLIDYKGGGMANIFDGLPHIAGKITNLSGSALNRSLVSIKAELKTRQRLFEKFGINHIDKYQKLYKEGTATKPLPHLVIISDEFAQLKTQQPDFMRELIDVAQIGRSLGIHLILATQKPAGVVDEQIWGNSRFRVCLKVLDKHDSNEMIRKPDAALIKQPGRAYVQVGYDEVYEYLQSGFSGIDYAPTSEFIDEEDQTISFVDSTATPIRVAQTDQAGLKTGKSQLESIIASIIELANHDHVSNYALWLEPLKEKVALSELREYHEFNGQWLSKPDGLRTVVGLADLPEYQEQVPVEIDLLKDGHTVIYGTSGTGKTTFLQTLIYSFAAKYSPDDFRFYLMDFGGRSSGYFANMPHCEEVVFADDEDKVAQILEDLMELIEDRKVLFSELKVSSFEAAASKTKLPAVMVAIDNYSVFKDRFYQHEDSIVNLVANGKAYGIFFMITGNSKNAVYYKVTDHVSKFITLRLNDPMHYREILGTSIPVLPDEVRGRGLVSINGAVEFQTALVIASDDESERVNYIQAKMEQMAEAAGEPQAKKKAVRNQPKAAAAQPKTTASVSRGGEKPKNSLELIEIDENVLYIGDLRKNKPQGIALQNLQTFLITGFENSGKTDYLKFLMGTIKNAPNARVILIDRKNQELEEFAKTSSIRRYLTAGEFDSFVKDFEVTVKERLEDYQKVASSLDSDEEIFGYMQKYEKVFVYINGFSEFFETISDDALEIFTKLVPRCKGLNIFFVTLANPEEIRPYSSTEIYMYLINESHGVFMGGNVKNQGSFIFAGMSSREREQQLDKHEGIVFSNNKFAVVKNPSVELEVAGWRN